METTLRKTGALLGKDLKDLVKNPTMLICTLLPIAFVLLYAQMSGGSPEESEMLSRYLVSMAFCITAGMVGSMTVLTAIAEEKEKNTLRTLMLANVSAGHILASRGIVAFLPSFSMANDTLEKLAPFFPTGGASELIELSAQGSLYTDDALQPLLVTLAWMVISVVAFALLYRRLSRDN